MSVKDVPRGTANCNVLQEGRKVSDHQHVSRATPLQTKMKEFAASKAELGSELGPDLNKIRQQWHAGSFHKRSVSGGRFP